jgi:hypothetical protein
VVFSKRYHLSETVMASPGLIYLQSIEDQSSALRII